MSEWVEQDKEDRDDGDPVYSKKEIKTKIAMQEFSIQDLGFTDDEINAISQLFSSKYRRVIMKGETWNYPVYIDDYHVYFTLNNDKITVMVEDIAPEISVGGIRDIFMKVNKSHDLKKKVDEMIQDRLADNFSEKKSELREVENLSIHDVFDKDIWRISDNLIYRGFGDKVYLGYIIDNTKLNQKFSNLNTNNYKQNVGDYEYIIDKTDLYEKGLNYRKDYMHKKVYGKVVKQYISQLTYGKNDRVRVIKSFLESNKDMEFTEEDSYKVGNCKPGTRSFMQEFGIKTPITAQKILEHKQFDKMIQKSAFIEIFMQHNGIKKALGL